MHEPYIPDPGMEYCTSRQDKIFAAKSMQSEIMAAKSDAVSFCKFRTTFPPSMVYCPALHNSHTRKAHHWLDDNGAGSIGALGADDRLGDGPCPERIAKTAYAVCTDERRAGVCGKILQKI